MMEIMAYSSVSIVLVVLLFFALSGSTNEDEISSYGGHPRPQAKGDFSLELIQRLFSREDCEFVAQQGSALLLRAYRRERKTVAMYWVRETSTEISRAMREHVKNAGRSANLKVAGELQMFGRFLALRIICGVLVVLMRVVDLHVLLSLATRTGRLAGAFRPDRAALGLRNVSPTSYGIQ